jgi:hypothetical protein
MKNGLASRTTGPKIMKHQPNVFVAFVTSWLFFDFHGVAGFSLASAGPCESA